VLNGTNSEKCRDHITIVLKFMDLDYALRTDEPPVITDKSTVEEKANYKKWERFNRMSLMVMNRTIPMTIKGVIPDKVNAKSFLTKVADWFNKSDKVEANTHINKLINMRYNGKGNIREYIMKMSNLVSKLKALKLKLSKEILVHFILISFSSQYNLLKIIIMLKGKSGVPLSSSVTVSEKKRD